jgi:hypothetical protein
MCVCGWLLGRGLRPAFVRTLREAQYMTEPGQQYNVQAEGL